MIRVAYVSHFGHMRMGGQKSMVHLIEFLDRIKVTPFAICPQHGELSEKLESIGCPTKIIPLYSIKPKYYTRVWESYRLIKQYIIYNNIDIIHTDRDADALICGLAKRNTKTKMIWHARVNSSNPKDKWNFGLADGVIGVSNATANRFKKFPDFNIKYKTIFNGVDTELFKPANDKKILRQNLGLDSEKFILIFVGQITKGKGVFDLIEGLSILKARNNNSNMPDTLLIGKFGSRDEETEITEFIKSRKLTDFIGIVEHQKNIIPWMQSADALIIPSHEGVEGMPRVLYEAMACSAAGIGSDTSGVRETIDNESGLLVEENSPEDIADKIELLINDNELLNKLRKNGRIRAVKLFDIRQHTRNIENFYEEIMNL
jgi:glycosyltransferase involved in cell wall biosynthesis